jgi:hypothetical protein
MDRDTVPGDVLGSYDGVKDEEANHNRPTDEGVFFDGRKRKVMDQTKETLAPLLLGIDRYKFSSNISYLLVRCYGNHDIYKCDLICLVTIMTYLTFSFEYPTQTF